MGFSTALYFKAAGLFIKDNQRKGKTIEAFYNEKFEDIPKHLDM